MAENNVSAIEMRSFSEAEEELATVCAWASISHGEDTTACMLVLEVLVSEVGSVDRLTTFPSTCRITSLDHETSDISMDLCPCIIVRGTECQKVIACYWSLFYGQLKFHIAKAFDLKSDSHEF